MLFNKYIEELMGKSPQTKLPENCTSEKRAEMLRNSLGTEGKDFDVQHSYLSRPFDKKEGMPEYFTESQLKAVSDIISGFRLTEDELKKIQYGGTGKAKDSEIQSVDKGVEEKVNAMLQLIDQHFLKTDPEFARYCKEHTKPGDRVVQRRIMQAYRFRAIGTIMNNLIVEQNKLYAIQNALKGIEKVDPKKPKKDREEEIAAFKRQIKENGGADKETKETLEEKFKKLNVQISEVARSSKALTSLNRRYADNNLTTDITVTVEKPVPIERKGSVSNKVSVENKAPYVESIKTFNKTTVATYLQKNDAYKGEGKKSLIGSDKFKNYAIIKKLQTDLQKEEKRPNKSSVEYFQGLKACYDLAIKEHKKTGIFKNPGPIWKELEKLSSELGVEIAKLEKLEPDQSLAGRLQQSQNGFYKQVQSAQTIPSGQQQGKVMLSQKALHNSQVRPIPQTTALTSPEVSAKNKI